jgi:UDP-N-acetylmuramyl pentapeptide phosphotransferase/UDP-N-acetylglucosamine-1-phosphate transferase
MLIELFSASATPITPFSIILILSLIPLYYFNFKKSQKVFLGDSGSLLLGTVVSIYIFYVLGNEYQFKEGFQMNKVLFTVLVVAYPLIDLLRVFILRIKEGKSPFVADQKHLHHLILKKTKKQVITTLIISMCSLLLFILIFIIKLPLTLY